MTRTEFLVYRLLKDPSLGSQLNGQADRLSRAMRQEKMDTDWLPVSGGSWDLLEALLLYHTKFHQLPQGLDGLCDFTETDESAMKLRGKSNVMRNDAENLLQLEFDAAELSAGGDLNTLADGIITTANKMHVNWILDGISHVNHESANAATKKRKKSDPHGPEAACDRMIELATKARVVFAGQDAKELGLHIEAASSIEPERLEWLWENRVPGGKVTLWAGTPGTGKSTCAVDLIARTTTGNDWPDGAKNTAGVKDVLIAVSEDDLADTLVPRLMAAGADLTRVHIIQSVTGIDMTDDDMPMVTRPLQLKADSDHLKKMLAENPNIALVVLDPISSYFGDCNPNKDEEVRPVMHAIADAMEGTKAAFLGIIHNNKRSDAKAIEKILGASSIVGVARAVWAFLRDDDNKDECLMSLVKGNLSKKRSGLRYAIVDGEARLKDGKVTVSKIDWLGDDERDADDVMAEQKEAAGERKDSRQMTLAKAFLTMQVKGHPVLARDMYPLAEAEGINERTLRRALHELGISWDKRKDGTYWLWPVAPDYTPETDEQVIEMI